MLSLRKEAVVFECTTDREIYGIRCAQDAIAVLLKDAQPTTSWQIYSWNGREARLLRELPIGHRMAMSAAGGRLVYQPMRERFFPEPLRYYDYRSGDGTDRVVTGIGASGSRQLSTRNRTSEGTFGSEQRAGSEANQERSEFEHSAKSEASQSRSSVCLPERSEKPFSPIGPERLRHDAEFERTRMRVVNGIGISRCGRFLAAESDDLCFRKEVVVYDLESDLIVAEFPIFLFDAKLEANNCFSDDSRFILCRDDNQICILDLQTKRSSILTAKRDPFGSVVSFRSIRGRTHLQVIGRRVGIQIAAFDDATGEWHLLGSDDDLDDDGF